MSELKPAVADAVHALSEEAASKVLEKVIKETLARQQAVEAELREQQQLATVTLNRDGLESSSLAGLWRVALMYSRASILPEHYRGQPENCLIALQMAQRCKMDPFAFMQSSYIVHGRPGIEGKLVIAMLNASGKIEGRIRFEFSGEGKTRSCTAIVKDKESGELIKLPLDWKTVEAEGWHLPKGKGDYKQPSKWTTIPDQMFRYRSAVFLVRAHYPEVMMGLHAVEELEDVDHPAPPVQDRRPKAERLADDFDRPRNEMAAGELPDEQRTMFEPGDAYEGTVPSKA